MKKLAKIFSLLCCVIIATPLVACSGERKPVSVDPFVDDYDPNKEYNIAFSVGVMLKNKIFTAVSSVIL